ncbi:MAG: tetratricopeptide repeat protein [Polyangiales bacterium]
MSDSQHDAPPQAGDEEDLSDALEPASEEQSQLALSHAPPPPADVGSAMAAPAPSNGSVSGQPATGVDMISRLRAEATACEDPARKAILLHEAGELEERVAGDELGAAREFLAAYNIDASFREPLEALLRILERRRSLKNLARVLDSLSKSAETSDERARALRALASDAADVRNDRDAARDYLEQAVDADASDQTAWLMLEIDAAVRKDGEGRRRALARRVELASDPKWAGLLRVDLAEEKAEGGEVDDALDVLVEVVTSQDEAAFRACEVAERLARKGERLDREAWALVQRGEIILESLRSEATPRGRGVPRQLRLAGVASDAFVRAAACYRSVGRHDDEIATIERAIQVDPNATMPYLARIAVAMRNGDLERASEIARGLLARSARPELAPQLWLTVAEAALARGDREGVIEACARLLEASREGDGEGRSAIVPKTLLSDLLLDGSDPGRLAELIEADAAARPTPEGRARGYLVSAAVRAVYAEDAQWAQANLEKAQANGADPIMVARLAAALAATMSSDTAWYEGAIRALRAAATDPVERADLEVELARLRLAAGDRDGARNALAAIDEESPRAGLARMARVVLGGDAAGDALIARVADGSEGDAAVAFAVARAVRASRREEQDARAEAISALGSASEEDALAALARVAAKIEANPKEAASILRELSRSENEPVGRDVLRVAAAFLLTKTENVDVASEVLDELETESLAAMSPARAVIARVLAKGEDAQRREAMELFARDVLADDEARGGWSLLERAADRLINPVADGPAAEALLASLSASADPTLARTATLLQALWPDGNVLPDTKEQAIGAVEELGGDAARQLARASLRRATRDGDPATAILAAEGWHRTGGGVPAALEALIASEQATDAEAEVRARVALASSLTGPASQLMAASASLVALVSNQPVPPLPKTRDPELATTLALAEAELAAPGDDPRRREVALRGLADVLEGSSSTLHEMAAWSALARGDHASARALFARALELAQLAGEEPRSALEGAIDTELMASGGQASRNWAELAERLARHVEKRGDRDGAAQLWEQVGHQWWDKLGDTARGEIALGEAFARDNKRKAAFERVFRAVRARKEDDKLLALVGRRLEATDDPPEMAKLFWEQARVLRAKGDRDGALSSLENVTMLEPDHVGALALSAEIYVGRQMYEEAAGALDRLSRQPVPAQQKLGAGLGAADLYESKLEAHDKALDVLVSLDKSGLSDVAIHERIARAAARAQAWVPATKYLEKLVKERRDSKGRVEAARLAAAIYREKLDDPQAAVPSLVALLREAPDDVEAIEHLIEAGPNPATVRETMTSSRAAARAILAQSPAEPRYARIVARSSAMLGESDLQQIALGLLVALQQADGAEERTAAALASRLGTAPAVALDRESARRMAAAEELGPVLDLFRVMGPTIAEALGPTTDALAVGRRERVDARAGNALRNEIAAWAGAIGIAEFEFYQGGKDPNLIQGVPAETPAIVVGANIRAPLSLVDRARLVRELVALERGTTVALLRDDVAVAAVIVASCAIAEVPLQTPAYAVLAETQRLLSKAISRKTKKLLPDVANAVAKQLGGGGDLRTFRGHALRTLDRAAAIAAGDPGAALVGIVGPNAPAAKIAADPRAAAMLRFVWSDDYLALRRQLGLGVG